MVDNFNDVKTGDRVRVTYDNGSIAEFTVVFLSPPPWAELVDRDELIYANSKIVKSYEILGRPLSPEPEDGSVISLSNGIVYHRLGDDWWPTGGTNSSTWENLISFDPNPTILREGMG